MTTSRLPRLPQALTALAIRRPWTLLIAAALAAALALWVAATRLELRFGHTDLVSASDRYRQLDEADRREFEEVPGRVVVVVHADDPEQAKAFAAELATKWAHDPKIERVVHRIHLDPLKAKALWYLSPADLAALRDRLGEHQERLVSLAGARTLDDLLTRLNREVTSALVGRVFTGFLDDEDKQGPPDLTLVLSLLRELNRWLEGARTYRSPWTAAIGGTTPLPSPDGFLWSDDQRLLFVLANPRRDTTQFNRFASAVEGIRSDLRDLQHGYPGVEVGLTGRAVIEADEMAVAQRDMALATLVAVLGVAALFVAFFRGLVRPAFATLTLILGVCWSLGVTTMAVGHLNILTIVFMPMLVGLGDHSIHFIARFEEERRAGRSLPDGLERTLAGTGMGIVAATGTTALAFAMLLLTGFKGLMELGIISASGILLTAGATLTVLPALLVLGERWHRAPERREAPRRGQTAGPGWLLRHPRAVLAASALLVALALVGLRGIRFDFSLLQLQAHETEAITWAQRVAQHTKRSVLFDEIVVASLEEAKAKVAALKALPSVAEVDSVVSVLPTGTAEKRELIRELRPLVAALPAPTATPGAVDIAALRSALERLRFKMVEGEAASPGSAEEQSGPDRREARNRIDKALGATGRMEASVLREALSRFQSELFRDLAETLRTLKELPDRGPVSIEDLPPELRARYVGRTGQYRLFVYPAENVWEFDPLSRFVADVQSVDPDARGTTVTTFQYLRVLKEGYTRAALYAVIAVAVLAWLVFRAMVPALLALVPLTLGAVWTLGAMGWMEVPLNAANLLLLPLIVGVGIDNGMYLVHRFREATDGADAPLPLAPSAAKAITLASLTNMVGFGSLMLSSHRGIFSLGLVVALGVACLWVATVTALPSLLALIGRRRPAARALRRSPSLVRVPAVSKAAWTGHVATVRNRPVDSRRAMGEPS